MCIVDLEKAYDRVPQGELLGVQWECGVSGLLLRVIHFLLNQSESCVRILSIKSNTFTVGVGLCQGCLLSPILFVIFMDRISRCSHGEECVWFRNFRAASLLFAHDVVLLVSSSCDLQQTLEQFAVECEVVRMRDSTSKSETMVLCRKMADCPGVPASSKAV